MKKRGEEFRSNNFDGRQTTPITRQGDTSNAFFSVPNFYGAHGYDPTIRAMSAIFYAAGPDIVHQAALCVMSATLVYKPAPGFEETLITI